MMFAGSRLSFRPVLFFITVIVGQGIPLAQAQDQINEVHIQPRVEAPASPDLGDGLQSSLNTHTEPFHKYVDLVLVPVTITDAMDRVVTGLEQANFQLFEGKEPQQIQHFTSEDVPVSLGIILDVSGSMGGKIELAREAVAEFLKAANPQDEFFMITFADRPELIGDFSKKVEDIQSKLLLTSLRGRTALLDAIYLGFTKMRQAKYQRRALLIISDGGDNHSRYTVSEIKAMVKEADVSIYAIGIFDRYFPSQEEALGPQLLSDITDVSGGRSYILDSPNYLPAVAERIGTTLRNQYVLGYRPKNLARDGKWRKIKVKLRLPRGLPPLHVVAKTGYYASSR